MNGPVEQQLGPSVTMLPTPGDMKAAFPWPPQMVSGTREQAVTCEDMESMASSFPTLVSTTYL